MSTTGPPASTAAAAWSAGWGDGTGTDIYLVYDEGLITGRAGKIPYPPFSSGRALYLKFSRTFDF